MPLIIKRTIDPESDFPYVATYKALRSRQTGEIELTHVTFTADKAKAKRFTEDEAKELCDLDFFGQPYRAQGYGSVKRPAPYEREQILEV